MDFATIYTKDAVKIVHHAIARCGVRPADVRDVAQMVWSQVFQYLPAFRGDCHPHRWLRMVAQNTAISYLRKRRDEQLPVDFDLPDARGTGLDVLIIREAIARLSDRHQQVLEAHMRGLTGRELAKVLDISPSGAGWAVRRALLALERAILGRPTCEVS